GYDPALRTTMLVTAGVLCGTDLFLLSVVVHPDWPLWNAAFRVQMFLVVTTLPVVFAPFVSAGTLLVLSLILVLSLLPLDCSSWLWGELRFRSAAEPRMDRT